MRKQQQTNEGEINRILWAVDAFPESFENQSRVASAIRAVGSTSSTVEPVCVLRSQQLDLSSPAIDDHGKGLCLAAEQNLEKFLATRKLPGLIAPRFLTQGGDSIRYGVREILKYAQKSEASLIALSTHARKGASRFFLGSFAETLILHSPIPVLVTNPKCSEIERVEHILFPTDFSESSREVFENVLAFALEWNAKIIIYHRMEYLYRPIAYPLLTISDEDMNARIAATKLQGERWVYFANQCGVDARFHLSKSLNDVASTIVGAAKKLSSGIIAMASQSGPITSSLVGSVTRQVIRSARIPVLVLHARGREIKNSLLTQPSYERGLRAILT